jgi:hypothetical protein
MLREFGNRVLGKMFGPEGRNNSRLEKTAK